MISSLVTQICDIFTSFPVVGSLVGSLCGSIVSFLQSLGL